MGVLAVARRSQESVIYEAADRFRHICLVQRQSFLWPEDQVWTPENVQALLDAYMGNPDESDRPFLTKWHDQLAGEPETIHKLAADVLAFYFLFLSRSQITKKTKLERLSTVVSWKLLDELPDLELVDKAFDLLRYARFTW